MMHRSSIVRETFLGGFHLEFSETMASPDSVHWSISTTDTPAATALLTETL